jgi:Zn-dependent peptidase ImmA (M78 family)
VRRVRQLREAVLSLAEDSDDIEQQFPRLTIRARLEETPERAAARTRDWLKVSTNQQRKWSDTESAFRYWRDALEAKGVLVFVSMGKVPVEEMRGFCLVHEQAPVVVVNNIDAKSAQVFTLFHEVGHLLLREEGICLDLDFDPDSDLRTARIETWCNHFAGALLAPADVLESFPLFDSLFSTISSPHSDLARSDIGLREIARALSVSPEVIVRRMMSVRSLSAVAYRRWRHNWYERHPIVKKTRPPDSHGPGWTQLAMYRLGMGYLRIVFSAYWNDAVTLRDLCDYVGAAKVETAQKLEGRFRDRLLAPLG